MVSLTRLDGSAIIVSAAHIVSVEATPNTMLVLHNGSRLNVREPVDDVCHRVRDWCRAACSCACQPKASMPCGSSPTPSDDTPHA